MSSFPKYQVYSKELGIVTVRISDEMDIDAREITEIKQQILDITKGATYASIIIPGENSSVTREALNLTASQEYCKNRAAMALMVHSLPQRILANFYIKFKKPVTPTRSFTDEDTAIAWLREHL